MAAGALTEAISTNQPRTEVGYRRIFFAFAVVAAAAVLCQFGLLLWAQNSFTGPETVVAGQSMMLARHGTLYYDLNHYPYTVCAYNPLFYLLDAGLFRLGLPAYVAGRLIGFSAFLGILFIVWRLLMLYTRDRDYAGLGVLMCASSSLLLSWGTVGQVDTLAVCLALAAFYQYSRYALDGDRTLAWAGALALLAFFTKQTMIACPAAIAALLWFRNKKLAAYFAGCTGGVSLLVSLALNAATGGRYLSDTLLANLNPFSPEKLFEHLRYTLFAAGWILLVAAVGARSAIRSGAGALFAYLGTAIMVFGVTAPKIGSDLNYQIELTVLLILCACASLHSLGFLPLLFGGSKKWLTLLQLPVAVFLVVNYRVTITSALGRFSGEQTARTEIEAVRPYLSAPGRVLSADYNAVVRLRGGFDLEMLIYKLLVDAGVVNPEPVQRDIAAGAFSAIVLFQDIEHDSASLPVEISTLPATQLQEIRKHYKLVRNIPGAWNGIYIYQPAEKAAN